MMMYWRRRSWMPGQQAAVAAAVVACPDDSVHYDQHMTD